MAPFNIVFCRGAKRAPRPPPPLQLFAGGWGGGGWGGIVKVIGGSLGVIIDARGRPLRMLAEPSRRRELLNKWLEIVVSGQH